MNNASRLWQIDARYLQFMALRAAGLSPDTIDDYVTNSVAQWLDVDPRPLEYTDDGIAIVTISGPLYTRKSPFASNYRSIGEALQTLIDTRPRAAILKIDSPGGMVNGLAEVVSLANQLAEQTLTVAVVSGCCCSAAYRIASQCGTIVATADSDVGSIGTYWQLIDYSKAFADAGLKSVLLTTGPFKGLGVIGEPINEDQQAFLQENVNKTNLAMLADVATGRHFTEEQTAAVSDGRFWLAEDALALGLIDQIGGLSGVLAEIRSQIVKEETMAKPTLRPPATSQTTPQETNETPDQTDDVTTPSDETPEPTTTPEPPAEAPPQQTLSVYMECFGDAEGARMFRDGVSWQEAAMQTIIELRGQQQDLRAENAALQGRLAELGSAMAGEAAPVKLNSFGKPKASLFGKPS